jgi:signal transduction histidine kinase
VLQFVGGFVVGLLTVTVLFLCKKATGTQEHAVSHLEQLEELSKLTGGLAHEIKNPLSTVKINLKLVSEDLEDFKRLESSGSRPSGDAGRLTRALRKLAVIEKETDRLEQILEGFLHYVGRPDLQLTTVDINELVGDMIDFYSPQARTHAVTIRQGLYSEPLVCKIDADMIKQVLLNLFINAQQAMSGGGALMVRTDRRQEKAIIEVSDTGGGIPADKVAHIFDAYYTSRPQGSGLGLPTAKKIIDAHGGSITVRSEMNKGTAFIIRLPLWEK